MNKYISLLLIFAATTLQSCISTGRPDLPPKPSFREPTGAQKSKVYRPKGEWIINSQDDLQPLVKLGAKVTKSGSVTKVNLNGITIDGQNQKGDGSQSENQTPLFRARVPLVVENGFFTNTKNAATFYKPNSGVKNITSTNIGEDSVATSEGATNFLVQNCEFIGKRGNDKLLQLNEAQGARVLNNTFYNSITAIRLGKLDYSERSNKASGGGNIFIGNQTAWHISKIQFTFTSKNKYRGVEIPILAPYGAKIINADAEVKR